MKRKAEDAWGEGSGGSGEKAFAKKLRELPSDFDTALGEDQLEQVMTVVSEVVTERVKYFFAESPETSDDVSLTFFGRSQDFIEKELLGAGPFVFGTPDMMEEDSPEHSGDEFVVVESEAEEETLENPEEYARLLAEELCDEILDEIVDEDLYGWQDEAERAEVLEMTEIASLRGDIRAAVYEAVWEEWEESSEPSGQSDL